MKPAKVENSLSYLHRDYSRHERQTEYLILEYEHRTERDILTRYLRVRLTQDNERKNLMCTASI